MSVCQTRVGGLMLLFTGFLGLFLSFKMGASTFYLEYSVWECAVMSMDISVIFDTVSGLFLSAVCVISGSVIIYCEWYMAEEVFKSRFLGLVLFFVGSMICLITIPNFFTLLIGWDGLGLTSFLLVVYYQSRSSLGAGMITAISNRIGDVLIICCLGFMAKEGSWTLYEVGGLNSYVWVVWGVVVAGMTKSAQIPFSAWLPAAMAAPTPVSSLVHSSTLVTAGVYLLYRCYPGLLIGSSALAMLSYVSLMTLVVAGSAALVEVDAKKVVALSTLSQLSMMMFSLAIGLPEIAFFHLISHAMFKALLFLCVGVVIHENSGFQDIRYLGRGWARYPVSMGCMCVALFSLCGMPFMSGFYSKDCIVEGGMMCNQPFIFYIMLMVGLMTTFYYSIRVAYNVMLGINGVSYMSMSSRENKVVKVAYSSLFIGAVVAGYVMSEVMEGFKLSWEASLVDKMSISVMGVIAFVAYYMVLVHQGEWKENFLSFFLGSMGHMKYLSGNVMAMGGLMLSDSVIRTMDKGWLEKLGPQGAGEVLGGNLGQYNQHVQAGQYFQVVLSCMVLGYSFLLLLFMGG
uniref:NADH-ubiquinone oxidoreductase chain 5 n=1 Tax=Lithophaga curta TaxID=2590090 RepID=A0A516EZH4_9BIVA|nr:NADH dehydrogenase subunit 5 [Lithophaga curta]